jgi:hypothetical protein
MLYGQGYCKTQRNCFVLLDLVFSLMYMQLAYGVR